VFNHTPSAPGRQDYHLSPSGLDLRDVLPIGMRKHIEAARRVVHVVSVGGLRRRRADRWVSLSQDDGVTLTGSRRTWDAVRPPLMHDVIESDGHYIIGEKSLNYRIQERWEAAPFRGTKTKDPLEEGRIATAFRERRRRSTGPRLPVHGFLEGWVRRLTLDAEATICALASIVVDPEKLRYAERLVSIISQGGEYARSISVCDFGHRLHSPVTRMPKALRRAIRIDGKPLVEVDVSASQPILLGLLALEKLRSMNHPSEISKLTQREAERREEEALSLITWYVFTPTHDDFDGWMQPSDLIEFIDICASGDFYEELARTLGIRCRSAADRRIVKKEASRIIFGKHRPRMRDWRRFYERWPTITRFLGEPKRDGYKNAARTLQRLEAAIMIDGACGEFMERHPEVPVLSIHDSLAVPADAVPLAVAAINRAWESRVGRRPKLKDSLPE
jgi:hypothetical protein